MSAAHADYFRSIKTEIWVFRGPDALRFLNGISTPHLTRSVPGGALLSGRGLFLDPKGKILAPFFFVKENEQLIRLRLDVGCHTRNESAAELNQSLYDHINALIIADNLEIERHKIQILQVWSADAASHVSSQPLEATRPQAEDLLFLASEYLGNLCFRVPCLGSDAFELWPKNLEDDLVLPVSGSEISQERMNQILFDQRYLEFPNQLHVGDLPLEFGFSDSISFFKGCYRGQETIARATYRGKLVKSLCEMTFLHPVDIQDLQIVNEESQIVGEIRVLTEDRLKALGLLRFDAQEKSLTTALSKVPLVQVERLVKETNEKFR